MEIFAALGAVLTDPIILMWILVGAVVGMVVGAIPGLTASAAIAMLLPVTFYMQPLAALAFLYVIGKSGRYGGSIAAILFNTPGTAASAATQIDGYPLSKRGMSSKAMKVATVSSIIGDYVGEILLIAGVGIIAAIALKLGPPELFAVYFAAFVVIGSVIGKSITRGLASAALGVLIKMIGLDPISNEERFTFGSFDLTNGISLVPLMIGIFVLGEVFSQLEARGQKIEQFDEPEGEDAKAKNHLSWAEYKPCVPHVIRSSFIGAFIGMLPGLGSAIAAFVAYGEGKRKAKNPEQWGKGALEGIAAPEAANNAVSGPSMAPLLTLGIPGSTIGAILVGVFLIHGIQVGPTLFLTQKELIYQLFACGLIGIALYGLIGYFGASFVGRFILKIPTDVLYPIIFLTSFIAAYSSRGNLFDVLVMVIAGFGGWLMKRYDFNPAAFVISFVLAGGAEETFRQALLLSNNGALIFFTRPVALGFLLLGVVAVFARARSLSKQAKEASLKDA
ncbi:Tripartite tricarboxylate transporter TctA family protein [Falsiruegeria litorea R37]|uniref:Tripartite tricarboxylate transporter TctA family protein n=1 Tax=Falsiruegeria litorea R37 TaxID=1200284 RepID=A0A1Y5TC03_9RHOB|nr:tripartite tricarboxylate transporter permease [Falsiruegeria litorea]SLN56988.1 Tripartite tricarboxylate transporter TctA family protein [Falsiruegeria litorea R37]